MHENYDDIKSRITEEPTWYDSNGTPRYGNFSPDKCPDIYSHKVVLMIIECQYCGEQFTVEMHTGWCDSNLNHPPLKWHYGDPPIHGCVGDTMNCEDLEVLEVWLKENIGEWERKSEFEGIFDGDN